MPTLREVHMGFLAPVMLLGAAAAAIPIAIHFFFRSRYRIVPWAAMKFLLTSIEQTSRRLRFQELLLLICRCALLILLALALARPLSSSVRGAGQGEAVLAVLMVDNSYSMGATDGAIDRFGRAKEAALKVIDQLPAHSSVQIITCADRANLIGPRDPGDLDQARALVQELSLTSLSTDLYPGIKEAQYVLEHGHESNKELYLFSDMQKLGWDRQKGNVIQTLQEIKEKATVFLVRAGAGRPNNVAIVGITPQSGVPRPGDRIGFAVLVRNTGGEAVSDVKLSLSVDGNDKLAETQMLAKIDPGALRAVPMTAKLNKAGLRVLTAKIHHDDVPGDNRFDQVIHVREQVNILVVDGGAQERDPEKWSSFNLMNALVPVKDSERAAYHLQPRLVTPRLAAPALLNKTEMCILVNVALAADKKRPAEVLPPDFVDALAGYVKEGKSLLIYGGDNVAPDAYNRLLGKKANLLPVPIQGFLEQSIKSPLKLDPGSAGHPAFAIFGDGGYYKGFKDIEIYKTLDLAEPAQTSAKPIDDPSDPDFKEKKAKKQDPVTVLFRYSNHKPAVVSRLVDGGEVVFIATSADKGLRRNSADPAWTDWPIHWEFVPFVDVLVSHLLHGRTQNHNIVAGEKLTWYPTLKVDRAYTLIAPDGKKIRLGLPEKKDNRAVVTAPDLPVAGVYTMVVTLPPSGASDDAAADAVIEKTPGLPIAVIPDLEESKDLSVFSDPELDERLGFRPIHIKSGGAVYGLDADERLSREWTIWVLGLVMLLALGETFLAYWCGRAI
jgi:hypothetical protein